MGVQAGRLAAAAGAVLAIVGVFLDGYAGVSYWDYDGTLAWTGLVLGVAAPLMTASSSPVCERSVPTLNCCDRSAPSNSPKTVCVFPQSMARSMCASLMNP